MSRQVKRFWSWSLIVCLGLTGCHPLQPMYLNEDGDLSHLVNVATEIEYPDLNEASLAEVDQATEPLTLTKPQFEEIWELSLEEAISIALNNSKVIRRLRVGGGVASLSQGAAPEELTSLAGNGARSLRTIYEPALAEAGLNEFGFGVEQALANFDAQVATSLFWERTDRPQNFGDAFTPIFARLLFQDRVNMETEVSKRTASGTQFFARSTSLYDDSTQTSRALRSDWFQGLELEARQPLLRGRGTQINRIPVVLARIQTDISLHDFEANVRNLVSDVERAYWALYFAYRSLDATKAGRDSALATWTRIKALYDAGAPQGEAENEAQSREQYFFFRAQVEASLSTLYKSERQLRWMLGLAPTDGRLIRPSEEPTAAEVSFDWAAIQAEALIRSPELREHKWLIKQRELELIAARNQLLPQLDVVALYRWLGLGDNLFGDNPIDPNTGRGARYPAEETSAWDELLAGDFQEGRLGFQLNIPVGYRAELADVRRRQLQLARDKAVLKDLELEVMHQLTDAYQTLKEQFVLTQTNFNRILASLDEVEAIQAAYDAGAVTLDRLLDAQRRRSAAEVAYFQALADYNIAISGVHLRKGSLLEYDGIVLAEGPWPAKAYFDAHGLARRRDASYYLNYGHSRPKVISRGPVDQQSSGAATGGLQFPESAAEPSGEIPLEPIPEPGIQTEELPLPDESPGTDLPMPSEPTAAGPTLNAPQVSSAPRQKPGNVRQVAHTQTPFEWGTLSLTKASPSIETTVSDDGTKSTDDAAKPAPPANQLKWKVRD